MLALIIAAAISSGASGKGRLTKQDVDKMVESLSNWGRWGKEDQLGTFNLITPTKRKEAEALVQEGVSVSLVHNVLKQRAFDSPPFEHRMVETGLMPGKQSAADVYSAQYHGFIITHMDALCHVFYGDKMYNGFKKEEVTDKGAARLSVFSPAASFWIFPACSG